MPARTGTRAQGQSWGSLRGAFRPRASVPPLCWRPQWNRTGLRRYPWGQSECGSRGITLNGHRHANKLLQNRSRPCILAQAHIGTRRKATCYSIASYDPTMCTALSISVNRKAGSFPISTRPRDQASGGRRAVRFSLPSALHAGEPRESDDLAARIGPAGPRRKPMLPYSASMIELAGVSFLVLLEGAQTLPRPLAWWDEQACRRGWRHLRYPRTAP